MGQVRRNMLICNLTTLNEHIRKPVCELNFKNISTTTMLTGEVCLSSGSKCTHSTGRPEELQQYGHIRYTAK